MTIQFNGKQLSTKRLGSVKINKIMLGITEVFPRLVPPIIVSVPGGIPHMVQYVTITPFQVEATGGVGPYVFTVAAGAFPTGITMSTGGLVSGTPQDYGDYSVVIRATDAMSHTGEADYAGYVEQAGAAWDPSFLFNTGDQGLFYNFNEIGAGNLVFGDELNTQVDFNAAGTWFVGSNMNVSGGSLNATTAWASGQSSHLSALVRSKTYFIEVEVTNWVGTGQVNINMGNAPTADGTLQIVGNGTYRAVLHNNSTSAPERLQVANPGFTGFSFSIDRLSCKEVLGGYVPTMFQLSTGAFPVGAQRQPIGLGLDLKYGLPDELLSDPGFDNPSAWFETVGTGWIVTGGQATFPVATANSWLNTIVPDMVAGKTYKLSFTVVSGSGLNYTAMVGGTQIAWLAALGMQSAIVVAGSTNNYVTIRNSNGAVMVVDNITLVEIEPTRAAQATAAARPQFNVVGNGMGAVFDGTDDSMASAVALVLDGQDLFASISCELNAGLPFGMLVEHGASGAGGGFYIGASATVLEVRFNGAGGTFYYESFSLTGLIGIPLIIEVEMKRGNTASNLAVSVIINGVVQTRNAVTNTVTPGTLFTTQTMFVGSRSGSSLRLAGKVQNTVIVNRLLTAAEQSQQREWSAQQLGVTLP